jgi:hypothetical protein
MHRPRPPKKSKTQPAPKPTPHPSCPLSTCLYERCRFFTREQNKASLTSSKNPWPRSKVCVFWGAQPVPTLEKHIDKRARTTHADTTRNKNEGRCHTPSVCNAHARTHTKHTQNYTPKHHPLYASPLTRAFPPSLPTPSRLAKPPRRPGAAKHPPPPPQKRGGRGGTCAARVGPPMREQQKQLEKQAEGRGALTAPAPTPLPSLCLFLVGGAKGWAKGEDGERGESKRGRQWQEGVRLT